MSHTQVMTSILCHRCKRPNGVSARICIWCRAEIAEGAPAWESDATAVEADYLEGLPRLDDPCPVRLIITGEGMEIVEMVPGSRSIKIPASAIVEISVAHLGLGDRNTGSTWWRNALEPLRRGSARISDANEECGYVLEVTYTADGEVFKAQFRYSDECGPAVARRLERILVKPTADGSHPDDHSAHG